jgi:hypothetical protein
MRRRLQLLQRLNSIMSELLHLSALLPAAVGVCCTVGGRRRRTADAVLTAVMLVAMADVSLRIGMLHPLGWCALLVLLAISGAVAARRGSARVGARGSGAGWAGVHLSALHLALGLITTAALLALMPGGGGASASVSSVHQHGGDVLRSLVLCGAAGYAGFAVWLAVQLGRPPKRDVLGSIESSSMAASVLMMVIAVAV